MARSHSFLAVLGLACVLLATACVAQTDVTQDMVDNADTAAPPDMEPEERLAEEMMTMAGATPTPCTHVRMPPKLCTACMMREHDDMGVFPGDNQRDIYVQDDACKAAMNQYVTLNPCDVRYGNAIRSLNSGLSSSFRRVAYFLYSVCEACCDCVPIGASAEEYDDRKAAGTLLNVRRGNCPAHFWWDTCKIWPDVRFISGKHGSPKDDRSNVCDPLKEWLDSPNGKGWPKNPKVDGLSRPIRAVLFQMMRKARCTQKDVWQTCANLESAQNRI